MELLDCNAHWLWDRDLHFHEYVQREHGSMTGTAAEMLDKLSREPEEQFFTRESDGRICVRIKSTLHPKEGAVYHLDPTGTEREGEHDVPLHGKMQGTLRTVVEGNALNSYFSVGRPKPDGTLEKVQINQRRVVKDGEYHMIIDNVSTGNSCTRVFRRFPYYKIDNETSDTVTLSTYNKGDMVHLVSAMTVQIPTGTHYIDTTGGSTEEKQAAFSLPDGKKYSGLTLRPFESCVLKPELFH